MFKTKRIIVKFIFITNNKNGDIFNFYLQFYFFHPPKNVILIRIIVEHTELSKILKFLTCHGAFKKRLNTMSLFQGP